MWTDKRFVEGQHHFSLLVFKNAGNKSKYHIGGFATFLRMLLPLEVYGDDDSKSTTLFGYWQRLAGQGVVAIYCVISNVHHCTFAPMCTTADLPSLTSSTTCRPNHLAFGCLLGSLLCRLLCGRVWQTTDEMYKIIMNICL